MLNLFLLIVSVLTPVALPAADSTIVQEKLIVERLPDLNLPRYSHNVFYAGNELTVVGGHTSGFVRTPTAEYYSDGEWHLLNTVYSHDNGIAVVLDEGKRVLLAGGHEKNLGIGQTYEVEIYYPETHSFEGFGCLDRNRALAQGVELSNGEVVITGNHQGNDAIEVFDGGRALRFVKDVDVWRPVPYVLPIGEEEVMVFGNVWREGRFQPCDTVSRLQGPPFCVPLLKDWMPIMNDQNSHCQSSFIGNKETGDYSYLVAAQNDRGEIGFLLVHDTVFTLLPTTCPVPTEWGWGRIRYDRVAVADRTARRAYLVGSDSTARVYVVAVEYGKCPSPITFYYSDPLPEFGDVTPVLTPDGNLVVVGGCIDNNFSLLSSVWLLRISDKQDALLTKPSHVKNLWWILGVLLVVASATVVTLVIVRRRKNIAPASHETVDVPTKEVSDSATDELMARIVGLMETERMYLNPELKVGDVAEALGLHRNIVSACINSHRGCTFSQFVNDYRLQHAKKLLLEASEMKISAVGMESGFANERSFFRAFKSTTGMTPKEWKDLEDR
ncbi:MAG: helix-turn-helix domain-containing protein [Bacteroidales bacterium]|nr:helix-turn-helix domain-containing protein [Bacteroidales bacterium]